VLEEAGFTSTVVVAGPGIVTASTSLSGLGTAISVGVSGAVGGAISTGSLKGTLIGAATAEAFWGVGGIKGVAGLGDGSAQAVALHAAVGCASAAASGGRCESGAAGAALGELATNPAVQFNTGSAGGNLIARASVSGIAGGVGTVIAGGNFGRGFVIGGAGVLFNEFGSNATRGYQPTVYPNGSACGTPQGCTDSDIYGPEGPTVLGSALSSPGAARFATTALDDISLGAGLTGLVATGIPGAQEFALPLAGISVGAAELSSLISPPPLTQVGLDTLVHVGTHFALPGFRGDFVDFFATSIIDQLFKK